MGDFRSNFENGIFMDYAHRLARIDYPDGERVAYGYDAGGQVMLLELLSEL